MEMARSAARPQFLEIIRVTPGTPAGEQVKLDRLRELHATIEALRREQRNEDPLLAWVMEMENSGKTGNP
jgi:hypothetical protein